MNLLRNTICLFLLLGSVEWVYAAPAKSENLNIMYVNMGEVLERTGTARKIRNALEKKRQGIQKIIDKKEKEFNKQMGKFRQEASILSENERMKSQEKLRQMQISIKQFLNEKQMEIQRSEINMKQDFSRRLERVVARVAQRKKIDVIRSNEGVLWVAKKFDLTSQVVKAYKKYKGK